MSKSDGILDLTIKKFWFEQIKSGEKKIEYRNYKTWKNKLYPCKYGLVRFRLGQLTKKTDPNKTMLFEIIYIEIINGKDTPLKVDDKVFAIHLGERIINPLKIGIYP